MIITKSQKKILLYAVIGIAVIILFCVSVYLPANSQMQKFQSQLGQVNKELNEVKNIDAIKDAIAKGYIYTQSIEKLKNELYTLKQGIPTEKEGPLQYISTSAKKYNIEITSIKPATEEPAVDNNKNRIKIKNSDCFQLPVSLKIKSNYNAMVNYIEALETGSPFLIVINNLAISKVSEQGMLNADINLTIYLKSRDES